MTSPSLIPRTRPSWVAVVSELVGAAETLDKQPGSKVADRHPMSAVATRSPNLFIVGSPTVAIRSVALWGATGAFISVIWVKQEHETIIEFRIGRSRNWSRKIAR
jgi:hypothetical protein